MPCEGQITSVSSKNVVNIAGNSGVGAMPSRQHLPCCSYRAHGLMLLTPRRRQHSLQLSCDWTCGYPRK